jgi:uncharacterized protein Yka (UPF0111/DUF47 family)
VTCRGRVDAMPLIWQEQSLLMEWCLDCHRHPERFIRPREHVFSMDWHPPGDQSMAVTYTAEGIVRLRDLQSLEELRSQIKGCEHRADDLERTIIKESYELAIAEIVKAEEVRAITADDLQRLFTRYIDKRKRREIAELSEAAVDACERVFHVFRNVYLKEL